MYVLFCPMPLSLNNMRYLLTKLRSLSMVSVHNLLAELSIPYSIYFILRFRQPPPLTTHTTFYTNRINGSYPSLSLSLSPSIHTYTHIYIYIYIYNMIRLYNKPDEVAYLVWWTNKPDEV